LYSRPLAARRGLYRAIDSSFPCADIAGASCPLSTTGELPMPKPNYAFAKRQREMAKKQKKEAKQRERDAAKAPADAGSTDAPPAPQTETPGG
jgi:hypothetical protein